MTYDPETGCTCLDETTRPCPVHTPSVVTHAKLRLNDSLLPQVSTETLALALVEMSGTSPERDEEIRAARRDLFQRENYPLYHLLVTSVPPVAVEAIIFAYSVLATQAHKDARWPA